MTDCPRCYAAVNEQHMAKHIDWHTGVRDGFHPFVDRGGNDTCHGVPNRPHWVGEEWCDLPADHWYHQPLPEVGE